MSVVEKVQHYQRKIEKCWDDEERMMHCISKLYMLPVTVNHLQETGVGRTVNSLRKYEGGVGDAAKALVAKWKNMVANEDSSDVEDEDEACVPDASGSHSDTTESPNHDEISGNYISSHNSDDLRDRSKNRSNKSGSSGHGSKHSAKGSMNAEVTSSRSPNKYNVHKERHSKTESRDHNQKHHKKSLKDSPQDVKKGHDSKDKNRIESDVDKVSSSTEFCEINGKDNHRKRKQENSGGDKDAYKKKKYAESDSEDDSSRLIMDTLTVSEPDSPSCIEPESSGILESETSDRKEVSGKEKKRDDTKHRTKSEVDKEAHRTKDSNKSDKRKRESHSSSKHSSKSKSSHSSSSSSRRRSKDNDTKRDKDRKDKREDKSKTSESKDNHKDQKVIKKIKKTTEENGMEIDSQSGTSFADALGMCMMVPSSRKRGSVAPSTPAVKSTKVEPSPTSSDGKQVSSPTSIETDSSDLVSKPLSLLAPNVKLKPLTVDLAATLPEISPNYKPLAHNTIAVNRRPEENKSLSEVLYIKNQRTKVFSGNKTGYTSVPSLYEICIRLLIENIDALEVTGGVPYYIIKPVLERATPDQLFMLEHHNPYLIEDTDPLWQFHCNREFRTKKREEMESWREMYMRCLDEREAKLKALTANIKQSINQSLPARTTIQVHDNYGIKPPRNVLRKQAKYGTARDLPITSSEVKKKLITSSGLGNATISCPAPPILPIRATSSSIRKKTKAPLMAKALQLIKGRYRR